MPVAKAANLALSFLLELCMLAALAYWGFASGSGLPGQLLLGIGAPLLAMVVWGIWLAPASARRLRAPAHLVLELLIFGAAFAGLYAAGQLLLTEIFAGVYALNLCLRFAWKQF